MPGSRLIYGSSLVIVTFKPRASKIAASEEAAMPLPNDDTTPPVINMNFVIYVFEFFEVGGMRCILRDDKLATQTGLNRAETESKNP